MSNKQRALDAITNGCHSKTAISVYIKTKPLMNSRQLTQALAQLIQDEKIYSKKVGDRAHYYLFHTNSLKLMNCRWDSKLTLMSVGP